MNLMGSNRTDVKRKWLNAAVLYISTLFDILRYCIILLYCYNCYNKVRTIFGKILTFYSLVI
jgi:hypothetical protein